MWFYTYLISRYSELKPLFIHKTNKGPKNHTLLLVGQKLTINIIGAYKWTNH